MGERHGDPTVRCPTCGTVSAAGALFCAVCGMRLTGPAARDTGPQATPVQPWVSDAAGYVPGSAPPPPPAPQTGWPEPPQPPTHERAPRFVPPSAETDAAQGAAALGGAARERRCEWCGAVSPAGEERCVACGAAFARPDQDAALQRAAEARMRAANESIDQLRRQRVKRGLGRFFVR
jgi:hypothetical protein